MKILSDLLVKYNSSSLTSLKKRTISPKTKAISTIGQEKAAKQK